MSSLPNFKVFFRESFISPIGEFGFPANDEAGNEDGEMGVSCSEKNLGVDFEESLRERRGGR
jgi:hypothetical protein